MPHPSQPWWNGIDSGTAIVFYAGSDARGLEMQTTSAAFAL
jgi:hypothetical protein